MVDELKFENDDRPWEHYRRDPEGYVAWAEEKKGRDRIHYPHVTGTGLEVREGVAPPLKAGK
jgi:hypothetical protein